MLFAISLKSETLKKPLDNPLQRLDSVIQFRSFKFYL